MKIDKMNIEPFSPEKSQEVIKLFTDVFSNSEGKREGLVIGELVTELINTTAPKQLLGYIGSSDKKVISCVFFSRLRLPSGKFAFILSPLAVSSHTQGNDLGQKLVNYGIQQLQSNGVELLFTYGDIHFYSKVGFKKIDEGVVKAPKNLTYPEGWLAQSLSQNEITSEVGVSKCVEALNKQVYW